MKVGQTWRTRSGHQVLIHKIDAGGVFESWPVYFDVINDPLPLHRPHLCRLDGRHIDERFEHKLDLIEEIKA